MNVIIKQGLFLLTLLFSFATHAVILTFDGATTAPLTPIQKWIYFTELSSSKQ